MSERRNPFRFHNTALGVRTDEDVAMVERTLRDDTLRLVRSTATTSTTRRARCALMEAVRTRYALLGGFDSFDVYVLR